uniref:Peroxidase n=1 Tax=Ananas comosus var. bracteatus TaxID=296719 RepID=A0A6V7P357_ANACO|nr:unnamed protein product [Ananas comosus var. bracteatus]
MRILLGSEHIPYSLDPMRRGRARGGAHCGGGGDGEADREPQHGGGRPPRLLPRLLRRRLRRLPPHLPGSGPGSSSSAAAERDAEINRSLPGDAFDAVARAKAALEQACPGAVSCADVLALAARHLVSMLGGPFYPLRLGRRDAPFSPAPSSAHVAPDLPRTNMTAPQLIALFASKGFTVQEMVALAGAHTVGFSHCKEFAGRIYNFENRGPNAFDPALNPRFAQGLQRACASYLKDPTISTFNDVMTPGKFDNLYFQNLPRGLGLLASDAALFVDTRTRPFVEGYAANQTAFFEGFARAMEKLSAYGVKTGRDGEIRRRCDAFNDHP